MPYRLVVNSQEVNLFLSPIAKSPTGVIVALKANELGKYLLRKGVVLDGSLLRGSENLVEQLLRVFVFGKTDSYVLVFFIYEGIHKYLLADLLRCWVVFYDPL